MKLESLRGEASFTGTFFTLWVDMESQIICPFFGKDENQCDIGCGYISPYDVSMIIKYCSSNPRNCSKYKELEERFPQVSGFCLPVQKPVVKSSDPFLFSHSIGK